jgi:hypothetical protein
MQEATSGHSGSTGSRCPNDVGGGLGRRATMSGFWHLLFLFAIDRRPAQHVINPRPMHGQQQLICIRCRLGGSAGACVVLSVACQPLEFVAAPRLTEYDFMSSSREDRSELSAHRTQDTNVHTALPRPRDLLLLSGPPTSAVLRGNEHLAPGSLRLRFPVAGDHRA